MVKQGRYEVKNTWHINVKKIYWYILMNRLYNTIWVNDTIMDDTATITIIQLLYNKIFKRNYIYNCGRIRENNKYVSPLEYNRKRNKRMG